MLTPDIVLQSRYRIIRLLGQGGMGAVYEALDERLDATVALKETLFADERLRKQFEREARLLARMHHPALPRVSDHFAEGEGEFLVMQFIEGDDLAQMAKGKQGAFPPSQVLTWGDQLLDALDYLHTQDPQIIHRDIKPQNLKLTSRGQIILLDFGLAKGQGGGVSLVTTSASIFGYTPNYAPLEQIQGLGTDARSDIYALSATLYHLMTGVKPPDALTRAAALVNGQPDPLTNASEIVSGIGPGVAGVLARAMSQNREQRFQNAAAMRVALKGTGEAATLVGQTEAATVLFESPAATLADPSGSRGKQTALRTDEITVVHGDGAARKKRVAPWTIAAAAVVLIGILFGGFYAYQHRSNSTATGASDDSGDQAGGNVVAEPAATSTTSTEPLSGSLKDERRAEVAVDHVEVAGAAKKNEKATRSIEKKQPTPSRAGSLPVPTPPLKQEYPSENKIAEPVVPEINEPDEPRMGGRRRQMGRVAIRNFPDGRQLITTPDGMRVMVFPDGTRRVLRSGGRVERRKVAP